MFDVEATPLTRGDLVTRDGQEAIVWDVDGDALVILLLGRAVDEGRHRADISFYETDLVGFLVSRRQGVVRCGHPVRVRRSHQIRLGCIAPEFARAIERAMAREAEATAIERSPPVRSHLAREDYPGIRGRQVGGGKST